MMKHKLWKVLSLLALLLLPGLVNAVPARAGDPDDTVGPANPNHLVCVEEGTHLWVDMDNDAFDYTGTYDPDAEVDAERLKKECEETEELLRSWGIHIRLTVEYFRQTRVEGYVFEFHQDPNGPGGWTAVRSQSVPVVASGPGFEVIWSSEKDGLYFFDTFGAGPITLNLRLPPDAHPINPDIIVMSRGFDETWEVDLAFYRGDIPPQDVEELRLPADHIRHRLIPGDTIIEIDEETGEFNYLPNVGGVLPQGTSRATIALAAVVLIALPAVGILKLRKKRAED
ncbi:MAG: hypothetical protein JXM69_06425 [Anaerolineae bacterium]|nr:hypothetical protein [Anaerolineae bacterium]